MDKYCKNWVIEIPKTNFAQVEDLNLFLNEKITSDEFNLTSSQIQKFTDSEYFKLVQPFQNDTDFSYLVFNFEEIWPTGSDAIGDNLLAVIREIFELHQLSLNLDGNILQIEILPELHHQNYAVAEFFIKEKIDSLKKKDLKELAQAISNHLETGQFQLLNVFEYLGSLEGLTYDFENEVLNPKGTYIAVSIILNLEAIVNWKSNKPAIIQKSILELNRQELNLSTYNENENVAFYAFTKDYD